VSVALFILYLVLVDKPRFDDTNVVAEGLTMEECEQASGALNGAHHAIQPEGQPRYLWICGPAPPPVEQEDIRRG
jgi:hypothetical protein